MQCFGLVGASGNNAGHCTVVMHKVCLSVPRATAWYCLFQVLLEECARLQHVLEHCKLVLLAEAQETSLLHLQMQCCAMVNKLE